MFNWLKKISDAISFRREWFAQKRIEKRGERQRLLNQYPAETLKANVKGRESHITNKVSSKYHAKTTHYNKSIKSGVEVKVDLEKKRALLGRCYEQESLECYKRKEQIKRSHAGAPRCFKWVA